MIINIFPNKNSNEIIINAANYISPIAMKLYTMKLEVIDNKWTITNINLDGIA